MRNAFSFRSAVMWVVAAVGLVVGFVSVTASPQSGSGDQVTLALIRELRELRVAIERVATVTPHVQLLSTRANQQEQHLLSLSSQLLAMRSKLVESSAATFSSVSRLEGMKQRLQIESDPKVRDELEQGQKQAAADVERSRRVQAAIQSQVAELEQQTTVEQSKLDELHGRLDALERSLSEQRR